jgi:hypothetical protein
MAIVNISTEVEIDLADIDTLDLYDELKRRGSFKGVPKELTNPLFDWLNHPIVTPEKLSKWIEFCKKDQT